MIQAVSNDIEQLEDKSPEALSEFLIGRVSEYNKEVDTEKLQKAIDFAVKYHGSQKRHSGDPYYYHPIAVSAVLAELHMDESSIITAILHDTVEDTEATIEDIEELFGEEVASLVEGVTKLTQIEFQSDNEKQAENFRKFLVAMSEDIRVLIVKLSDRLHNMRTLQFIKKPSKRQRIARETMEIYAKLAERIGINKIKHELQDMAFQELNTEAYNSIQSRLEYLRKLDADLIDRVAQKLQYIMDESSIKSEVSGREKSPYSIWKKMQLRNMTFEQLSDIMAFRVMVDSEAECYQALGLIHSHFHAIPETFKDYISTPKKNGYQSIHTVVMGPEQQRVEIQIRTKEMHQVAEMGVAAHWAYKQGEDYSTDGKQFRWIRELLLIIENANTSEEFLENTKLEMYNDQVFAFTPRGDLIALPLGATPVDFAFAVHSEIGRSCVGAKVNGRIMPLRTQLKNGDQVEVLLSKSQHPSPAWEHFAVTGKALSEIRKYMRSQQAEQYASLGKEMLENACKQEQLKLADIDEGQLLQRFGKSKMDELFLALGEGNVQRNDVMKAAFPVHYDKQQQSQNLLGRLRRKGKREKGATPEKLPIPIRGLVPGMAIHFAGCCHPLPGEKIVGIVNTGKGVTIHTADCGELEQYADQPERWLDVAWETMSESGVFVARLRAVLFHKAGALAELANSIAQSGGNINNFRITNRASDFFEILVDVEVSDTEHLNKVMAMLRSKKVIHDVDRYYEGKIKP